MKNIKQQIHLTESLMQAIVQKSPLGIVVAAHNSKEIIYTNTAGLRLGYPRPLFAQGNPLHTCWHRCRFFHPDGQSCQPEQQPLMRALMQGESVQGQLLQVKWPDNNQQWLQTAATPLYEQGRVVAAVSMFSDISDIMFQYNHLRELNSIKKQLLRVLAHDLRGTFNGLLFLSDVLSEKAKHNADTSDSEYIDMIKLSVQRAFGMTSDMLKWAVQNEGSSEPVYERIALHQLIDSVTEELRFAAYIKKIQYHTEVARDLYVYCDRTMIASVLRNLLSNAVKFSYKGNPVDLYAEKDSQQVWVTVKDYGTGMQPEEIKQFNTSHVSHSQPGTTGEQGSGIGLLICKDFIVRHRGRLQVYSNQGSGCRFVFCIPLKQ